MNHVLIAESRIRRGSHRSHHRSRGTKRTEKPKMGHRNMNHALIAIGVAIGVGVTGIPPRGVDRVLRGGVDSGGEAIGVAIGVGVTGIPPRGVDRVLRGG